MNRKFVVTTPRNILSCQPVTVFAGDRLEALTRLGLTVWTEEEWAELEADLGIAEQP